MVAFLFVLTVLAAAVLIGRGTAGSSGIVDRDAQRIGAELTAIARHSRP